MAFFRNSLELTPAEYKAFCKSYLSVNSKNRIASDKQGDSWGFVFGSKEAEWRWNEDEWKLYSDWNDTIVWRMVRTNG